MFSGIYSGNGAASPPYSPGDEDLHYLLSHSQQSLAFLLLLLLRWVFTRICRLSCGRWKIKKTSESVSCNNVTAKLLRQLVSGFFKDAGHNH